ncbi:Formyl transferase [Roseomonas rosea]|uniref:Formyl transferase n=1 Tax=Muricoccus roseus TaxID=198092 RepID=A0A1M6G5E5_9PROT|nr:formyltransferase family protein [Roseomonas rosea]SHJ05165.1 Formyl transferase [Roseomonas rosea]
MTERARPPPRLALLTLPSAASAEAVAEFAALHRDSLVLVGLSNPYRRNTGGALGQAWRHLRRSGPRMLGYLAVNMSLPRIASALSRRPGPLQALCRDGHIRAMPVEDVNGPAFKAALRESGAELVVTFHFDQILTAATLAIPPLGGINIHPSLLPRHRGPIPGFWAGLEAEPAYGATVHRLVPRIDAGAILVQRAVDLPRGTSASAAARLLHRAAVPLATEALRRIATGEAEERQAEPLPYCPFPGRATLREGRRRGIRLVGPGDIRAALRARL